MSTRPSVDPSANSKPLDVTPAVRYPQPARLSGTAPVDHQRLALDPFVRPVLGIVDHQIALDRELHLVERQVREHHPVRFPGVRTFRTRSNSHDSVRAGVAIGVVPGPAVTPARRRSRCRPRSDRRRRRPHAARPGLRPPKARHHRRLRTASRHPRLRPGRPSRHGPSDGRCPPLRARCRLLPRRPAGPNRLRRSAGRRLPLPTGPHPPIRSSRRRLRTCPPASRPYDPRSAAEAGAPASPPRPAPTSSPSANTNRSISRPMSAT